MSLGAPGTNLTYFKANIQWSALGSYQRWKICKRIVHGFFLSTATLSYSMQVGLVSPEEMTP